MVVRVEMIGRLAVVGSDGVLRHQFATRKAAALLGYLALAPGVAHPRESLIEMFWPDVELASGRNSLNVALNALRPFLGDALQTDRAFVQLRSEHVATDLQDALRTRRAFDPDQLLAGHYDDFVIAERERLKALGVGAGFGGSSLERTRRIVPGGAIPPEADFYVERATDGALREALRRGDATILLKGAHEVGKTSLLARGAQAARRSQARVALTDLSTLPTEGAEAFFYALAVSLADELGLAPPEELWIATRSPSMNLERFVRRAALDALGPPLVWAFDEVDRLFELPFGADLFRLFRSWHNRRSLEPEGPWSRLTLLLAYATEAQLFLTDIHQSPFNVGTRLALSDFTLEDTAELNRRFGSPLSGAEPILELRDWIGGQPFLNHLSFHALSGGMPLAELIGQASLPSGLFGGHLRRLSASIGDLSTLELLLSGGAPPLGAERFYRLRALGVLTGESSAEANFRCRLYREWFSRTR